MWQKFHVRKSKSNFRQPLCLCWRFPILEKLEFHPEVFPYSIFPEMTQFSTDRGIPGWQKWRAARPILRLYGFAFSLRFSDYSGCRGRLFLFNMVDGRLPPTVGWGLECFFLQQRHQSSLVTYLQLIFILSLDMEIKKIPSSCGWKDEIHLQWLWSNYSDLTGPHPKR